MDTFKTVIAEDGLSITGEAKILFGQCGSNKSMHLTELMEYCADYVMELYTQKGATRELLNNKGYIQMVSRSSLHINRMPIENEIISITVREEKPEGFQPMRYYEIKSKNGEVLIQGKSLWVTVNPETRAVVSPANFEYLIQSDIETPFEKKPGRIKIPAEIQPLGEQKILLSHLDPNGHLTNAKYINFAIDYLPEEYQQKEITDFRLNFCKEMKKGEIMYIFGAFDDENHKISIVGKRISEENEGKLESSFECELFYK